MGKNKNANKPLTQEEIWDDSALVRTWDEAVEEYKLYHSIHAKGENVEDVLREAETAEPGQHNDGLDETHDYMEADVEPIDSGTTAAAVDETQQAPQVDTSQVTEKPNISPNPQAGAGAQVPPAAPMPQATLSHVQDEGLKNLMMAWYYAGYYTGLHEGQQKANQNTSS
ncbi:hypothetical protein ASPWEDRAFT_47849 [Aspergillus wentii DTO 134E9]|uniref:Survival Motor Neuron Gemin2-binding domain-containing protein n=1 Tax=Aspergillus wentii DTO 134E9 TaxID=1073089 RepID=A0A1L9S240_ASPWE|nr:uncharacterized protein ASPWEDRAFT_47849 [Aspergillus wentii DTO 134E9]OJJ41226.1 hypothetical protein ASPWEDRAFT_47849 [Aspergillus wentii DTO 134E9]